MKGGVLVTNEIVKYENRLNEIPLRKFNPREMDLFFSIASRIRDKGSRKVILSFEQLKELSNYQQHGEQFVQDLNRTYSKLLQLNAIADDGHSIKAFVLFTTYEINRDTKQVTIAVNPDFQGIFNELTSWTRFSLSQFANLRSSYAKTMFRLLKQHRTIGTRYFTIEEFRRLLAVPASYRPTNIDKTVLTPIREELSPVFKGLVVSKKKGGRGNKLLGYKFNWKPEPKNADDFSKGRFWDQQNAINNVLHNANLTVEERTRQINRIKGLPLGTSVNSDEKKADEALRKQNNQKKMKRTALYDEDKRAILKALKK